MKITALMENTGDRPGILTEHGLSIYVETDRHKILFDSGFVWTILIRRFCPTDTLIIPAV